MSGFKPEHQQEALNALNAKDDVVAVANEDGTISSIDGNGNTIHWNVEYKT